MWGCSAGLLQRQDSGLDFPVATILHLWHFGQEKDCFLKNQTLKHRIRDLRLSNNIQENNKVKLHLVVRLFGDFLQAQWKIMLSTLLRVAMGFRGPNFPKTMKIPGFAM